MTKEDYLLERNRLNKENIEQNIASEIFINISKTSPLTDKFSVWLFAGTGATGALLISQIQQILPSLSLIGYRVCMFMLVASAIFAFIAKYWALRCQIQTNFMLSLKKSMEELLSEFDRNEDEIIEEAEQRGIELKTEMEIENVMNEFIQPFPFWIRWSINRYRNKEKNSRQDGYHAAIKAYLWQIHFTFLQSLSFISFLLLGGWFAIGL
jgi:hypothetical protein